MATGTGRAMPIFDYVECAEVDAQLISTAAELVGCVHDYGPEETGALLEPLSVGHLYQLVVVLAAAVDPDVPMARLLAWTEGGPVESRSFVPASMRSGRTADPHPQRTAVATYAAAGLSTREIAARLGISERSVQRHRSAA